MVRVGVYLAPHHPNEPRLVSRLVCTIDIYLVQVQGKNDFRPSVWKCVRMGVVRPSGNLVSRVSASRKQFAIHKGGHSV